jgi:peptidoglycan hydrolase CwlO-like protein
MEFTNSVSDQKWVMEAGRLAEEGEVMVDDDDFADANAAVDEIIDGSGNVVKVNKEATMSVKDRKKAIKELEKKLKEHKKKSTLSEDEMWELQDKLTELKEKLSA